jgi:hypothetical protein
VHGRIARACGLVPDQQPPDIDTDTLAGAYQRGLDGGSGMTDPSTAVDWTDAGGRVDVAQPFVVPGTAQPPVILPPVSMLADRALFGGVRTAPATREYVPEPGNTGGYVVISGRPNVQLGSITVVQDAPLPTSRTVPPQVTGGSCAERAGAASRAVDLADLQRDTLALSLGWDRR